jgi:AraC-like DNA-binding protein
MSVITRPLVVMHGDPRFQARIRQAAGREFRYSAAASWAELTTTLRATSPVSLVVVDPYHGSGARHTLASQLRPLVTDFPTMSVLAAVEIRLEVFADLRTLGEWGIAEVISLAEDNIVALSRLLLSVRFRPLQSLLLTLLPEDLSGRARAILSAAAEVAALGGQSTALARRLHVSMRTLLRWCDAAELPPPRQIMAWMRLLLAAELLEDPDRSVESVAMACGYAADSGLRRALRDFMDTNPRALRRAGALATASRSFNAALNRAASPVAA